MKPITRLGRPLHYLLIFGVFISLLVQGCSPKGYVYGGKHVRFVEVNPDPCPKGGPEDPGTCRFTSISGTVSVTTLTPIWNDAEQGGGWMSESATETCSGSKCKAAPGTCGGSICINHYQGGNCYCG